VKCFAENAGVDDWRESLDAPPRCPRCGSWLRPDVVWFGEMLPQGALEAAHVAAAECQVFLSVGTSTLVYHAAELPFIALNAGATVTEINPNPTSLTEAEHFSLRGSSGRVLPEIVRTTWGARRG
jgi:NAD-dependent deacetylase